MEQQETASIRFYTAGCMEFENFSECYEDLTLAQAVDIYKKIRKRNACNIPGIGFELQDPAIPDYSGIHWPLLVADIRWCKRRYRNWRAICRSSRKVQSTGTLRSGEWF